MKFDFYLSSWEDDIIKLIINIIYINELWNEIHKRWLTYLGQMINVTSLYLFQLYVTTFFKFDIIKFNNNTRNTLKLHSRYNIKLLKDFFTVVII